MQYLDFRPLGKQTSRIGLGCGGLVGRSNFRRSAKIVEAALDLGIRYFDVAPSYGMGTAEEVLGAVIGGSNEVTVATKVGIPRPHYSHKMNLMRQFISPMTDRSQLLKKLTRKLYWRFKPSEPRPPFDFSVEAIRSSLQESLEKLKRNSVDVFLMHEPNPADLGTKTDQYFQSLCKEGLIKAYGAGVGMIGDRWSRFGSIWQSCWPGEAVRSYHHDVGYIWHGAVRQSLDKKANAKNIRPSTIVRMTLEQSPGGILLVSASTPQKLKQLMQEIE